MTTERVCKKCGETKALEHFAKAPACVYGRRHTCIECYREQRREPQRERRKDPAVRKRNCESTKKRYKTPAVRERIRAYKQTSTYRKKAREYARERYNDDPAYRERQREYKQTPAYREQQREYNRERRKDPVAYERIRKHERDSRRKRNNDARHTMLAKSKERAKSRGMPHTLALDDIPFPLPYCPALGADVPIRVNTGTYGPNSPSLDRIDSDPVVGYVPHNIAVISMLANSIKGKRTPAQLYKRARTIFLKSEQLTGPLRDHQRYEAELTLKVAQYSERALRASRFAQHIENTVFLKFDDVPELTESSTAVTDANAGDE